MYRKLNEGDVDMLTKSDFKIGSEYKVKYEGEKNYTTRIYTGEHQCYAIDENGEIIKDGIVAKFEGRGGIKFYPYDKIISAEEVNPKRKKAKKLVTCNRCFGAGRFEHVAHVQNGICFKCGGSGTV